MIKHFVKIRFKNILKLSRFGNSVMAFIGVFLGAFIANIEMSNIFPILFAALSAAFISAYGNIHNDIIDIKIDTDEGKDRPLVTGEASIKEAKTYALFFLLCGNLLVINMPVLLVIAFSVSIMLYIYNRFLKRLPLIGNIVVAFMVGLTFLYGNLLSIYLSEFLNYDVIPFLLAFLLNFCREMIKDCEDIEGDSLNKIKTFPILFGLKRSQIFVQCLNILLLLTIIYPSIFLSYSYKFYIINIFSTIPIISWSIYKLSIPLNKVAFGKLSKLYKIGMLTGVLSLLVENI